MAQDGDRFRVAVVSDETSGSYGSGKFIYPKAKSCRLQ